MLSIFLEYTTFLGVEQTSTVKKIKIKKTSLSFLAQASLTRK